MTFPFFLADPDLRPEDFNMLAPHFARTVTEFLPCRRVSFVGAGNGRGASCPSSWVHGVDQVLEKRQPILDTSGSDPVLYLPVWSDRKPAGVAVLLEGEPSLYESSVTWLLERSHLVSREFHLLKQTYTDPLTGLLNGTRLHKRLEHLLDETVPALSPERMCMLGLLQISTKRREQTQGLSCLARTGAVLASLLQHTGTAHHLGGGVFGLLWEAVDGGEAKDFGAAFLRRLKREGYARAHLGVEVFGQADKRTVSLPADLVGNAWKALQTARKRGPFGMSVHGFHNDVDEFSRNSFPAETLSLLRKGWRESSLFSLVLFEVDSLSEKDRFPEKYLPKATARVFCSPVSGRKAFAFLDGFSAEDARRWARTFQKKIARAGGGTCTIGVATFPCLDFRKSTMMENAAKALKHARFFGSGGFALFDAVSLNISGDVYYNDGDLYAALREYKKGLTLDPGNGNLLNSLGVAYAQLNRYREAVPCFEKVLATDREDFMALYNLGFARLQIGDRKEALSFFERAFAVNGEHLDLRVQMGRLCCEMGEHEKAAVILSQVADGNGDSGGNGYFWTVRHCLGKAYANLGRNQEAISSLEQAVGRNSRDAASLSMLGELYAIEKQGDEIALSLCRKAVELEEESWENWHRLGKVMLHQGDVAGACSALQKSLQLNRKSQESALLLARIYKSGGRVRQARRMYVRVLKLCPGHKEAAGGVAMPGEPVVKA